MTGELLTGAASVAPCAAVRQPFEHYIRRFDRIYRRRLRKLKGGCPRLGDLLYTFPAAAIAIAAGRHSFAQRREAKRLAIDGRPLSCVAGALNLPMWTRSLPPEAFASRLGDLPDGGDFTRRIGNCLPGSPEASAMWLRWVTLGAQACDSAFALWLAKQQFYGADSNEKTPVLPLAAYAWFSSQPGTLGRNLMRQPWNRRMTFQTAVNEALVWLDRVTLDYCEGWFDSGRGWRREASSGPYRLVPLLSREKLQEEGSRMNNCVASYASKVAAGRCLIYSVRRGERRVATLEIVVGRRGVPAINQLLGPGNTRTTVEVRRAADAWLARRTNCPPGERTARPFFGRGAIMARRWEAVWAPFQEARPGFGGTLLSPEEGSAKLLKDLVALSVL